MSAKKTLNRQTKNFRVPWEEAYGYVQAIPARRHDLPVRAAPRTTAPIS
jgi:hypothetical protein